MADETQKSVNQMSEVLTIATSEINHTAIKLSTIKHDLSQWKQFARRNDLHNVAIGAMTDIAEC